MANSVKLTKTDFLAYLDSPKHLWAIKHNKLDKTEITAYVQHLFEQGYQVEKYAKRYIQEIILKQYGSNPENLVFQPKHTDQQFEARTDALIKNSSTGLWDMYEIKSTTKIDKLHKYDATFQGMVFEKNRPLGKTFLLHLNPDYIRGESLDISQLFIAEDISEIVEKLKEEVNQMRFDALEVIAQPDHNQVEACIRPKTCPCLSICHPDLPEYSIYDINRLTGSEKKIRQLEKRGIYSVYDVPIDFKLSSKQSSQVAVAKMGITHIDHTLLEEILSKIVYPIYFIDYESFNPAIPMLRGYKPYDQMPFQWSLHVMRTPNSELDHYEFIETADIDPIPNFIEALQKVLGETGSIVVWNQGFEGTMNKRIGEIHPQYREFCENMNDRMFDLMAIFRDGIYEDPLFKGSYSIKKVLPVLVPELSYKELNISEGASAMANWDEMVHKMADYQGLGDMGSNLVARDKIKNDLLRYCELDTLAMVRIFERIGGPATT